MLRTPAQKERVFEVKGNRLLALVLSASLVLTLAGCTITDSGETPPPVPTASEPSATPAPAVNPLMEAAFKTADVLNGFNTEKIGEYGYIEMQKSDMEVVTADQLTEFCKNKVDGSGLNFVGIVFEDGTGLHINTSSWAVSIPYGSVDPLTGLLTDNVGAVMSASWSEDGSTPASYEYVSFEELHEIQGTVETAIGSEYSGVYFCTVDFMEDGPGFSVTVLTDNAGSIETLETLIHSLDDSRIAEISITAMQDGKVIATN